MTIITTRRLAIAGVGGVFLLAAIGGWWWSAADRYLDPMRTFREMPQFERAEWMPAEYAERGERLENDVVRKRAWTAEDAAFIEAIMRSPRPGEPPPNAGEMRFPAPGSEREAVDRWLAQDGAAELVDWFMHATQRALAWSVVQERIRLGLNVPEPTRSFALESWQAGLLDADEQVRVESALALIHSRLIEDQAVRVKVEAMRLGDQSGYVRQAVDRGLKQYDRMHHGRDPGGPVAECSTCP